MQRIYNLTQHKATPDQVVAGLIDAPEDIRSKLQEALTFEEMPLLGDIYDHTMRVVYLTLSWVPKYSKVMIGGAPYMMSLLQNQLVQHHYVPVYAFSKRISEDQVVDGIVKKVSTFKHEGFVEVI